jgi:hypothetical protein
MSKRLKGLLVAAVCAACCIPLLVGIFGATTGIAGATSLWFRRYDLAILAGIGLMARAVLVMRDHRVTSNGPTRGEY